MIGPDCVALGDGEVDNAACIRLLQEAGYDGAVSLETEGELGAAQGQVLIERSRQYLLHVLGESR